MGNEHMNNNNDKQIYKTIEEMQKQIQKLQNELQRSEKEREKQNFILWTVLQKIYPDIVYFESDFIQDERNYTTWFFKYNDCLKELKRPKKYGYLDKSKKPNILSLLVMERMKNKHFKCLTSYQIQKMLKIDRNKSRRIINIIIEKNVNFTAILKPQWIPDKNKRLCQRNLLTL